MISFILKKDWIKIENSIREFKRLPKKLKGSYIIKYNNKVIYVGHALCLKYRFCDHQIIKFLNQAKKHVEIFYCTEKYAYACELLLIEYYQPCLNTHYCLGLNRATPEVVGLKNIIKLL